jgi:hypothetical protein
VVQHDGYVGPDSRRDIRPGCAWPKREWLFCRRLEGGGQQHHRVYVSVQHGLFGRTLEQLTVGRNRPNFVLFSSQVAQFQTPCDTAFSILCRGGSQKTQPVVHELLRILSCCAKVNKSHLYRSNRTGPFKRWKGKAHLTRFRIPQEIRPIGIRLHQPKLEKLFQAEFKNDRSNLGTEHEFNRWIGERKEGLTSFRSFWLSKTPASPILCPSMCSMTRTRSVLFSQTHGTLNLRSSPRYKDDANLRKKEASRL